MLRRCAFSIFVAVILAWLTACQPQGSPAAPPTLTPDERPTATFQSSPTASPSPAPTLPIQPAPVTTLPGETPAPASLLTYTQHGVTVILTRLEVSSDQTSLDFVAQVDPAWGFTFAQNDNPAQDVRSDDRLPSLMDETGHIYQPRLTPGDRHPAHPTDRPGQPAHPLYSCEPRTGSISSSRSIPGFWRITGPGQSCQMD